MDLLAPYNLIIDASVILIISYFFGEISRRTSVPSVLLLILLGVLIKTILDFFNVELFDFFPLLEILGIVGLIMIVLEAALELKLDKEKIIPISKAFGLALVGLFVSAWITALVFQQFLGLDSLTAWIYATPLSILSSAIIIPSVTELRNDKKEFHIYESTFSDILGIMLFYYLVAQVGTDHGGGLIEFGLSTVITIVLSLVFSYLIVILFQRIKSNVKLFLLIAVLLLLYAIGKKLHLSSLIIILVFGLVIANLDLFFRGRLKNWLHMEKAKEIYNGLHEITMETAFVVRTFFFVVFGLTITFGALASFNVLGLSLLLILIIYVVRYLLLRPSLGWDIQPQLFIAPRGLITILLFYAIPKEAQSEVFSQGILLYIILATSIIMTIALVMEKRRKTTVTKSLKSKPVGMSRWKAPGLRED